MARTFAAKAASEKRSEKKYQQQKHTFVQALETNRGVQRLFVRIEQQHRTSYAHKWNQKKKTSKRNETNRKQVREKKTKMLKWKYKFSVHLNHLYCAANVKSCIRQTRCCSSKFSTKVSASRGLPISLIHFQPVQALRVGYAIIFQLLRRTFCMFFLPSQFFYRVEKLYELLLLPLPRTGKMRWWCNSNSNSNSNYRSWWQQLEPIRRNETLKQQI